MSEYLSDAEQKEQIHEWWQENGRFILAGVVLGLVGIFGWRYWISFQDSQASKASVLYEEMLSAVNEDELDMAKQKLEVISSDFKSTVYLPQAHLLMAKTAVLTDDLNSAVDHLETALAKSKDRELAELIRFRLAKVRVELKEYDVALDLLNSVKSDSYAPLVEEMRGDIYRAQGDVVKARSAYVAAQAAMQVTPIGDPNLLQMKLSDLGVAN